MRTEYPSDERVAGGLVIGAAAATGPMIVLSYGFGLLLLPFALPITCLHAALVAAPVYYLLRRWVPLNWISCAIAGVFVGVTPVALTVAYPAIAGGIDPLEVLKAASFFAGSGLAGGVAFYWWVVHGPR